MTAGGGREAAAGGSPADGNAPRAGGAPGRAGTPPGEHPAAGDAPRGEGAPAQAGVPGRSRDDTVAAVVRQWRAVRPDLDTGPMEVIGRINRCAALLQQAEDAPLRRAGLTRPEFDLLGALRRAGEELTPGRLARETFSSGAAVTKRLRQLGERGLVERRTDPRDRRVAHVRLADSGRELLDGLMPDQLAYETDVLAGVGGPRLDELATLLGALLGQLEERLGPPPE